MFLSSHISSIFLVFLGTLESFEKPYALCPICPMQRKHILTTFVEYFFTRLLFASY